MMLLREQSRGDVCLSPVQFSFFHIKLGMKGRVQHESCPLLMLESFSTRSGVVESVVFWFVFLLDLC